MRNKEDSNYSQIGSFLKKLGDDLSKPMTQEDGYHSKKDSDNDILNKNYEDNISDSDKLLEIRGMLINLYDFRDMFDKQDDYWKTINSIINKIKDIELSVIKNIRNDNK